MMVADSDLPPIVGQQITLAGTPSQAVLDRITLLLQRAGASYARPDIANATECDAIVKGIVDGRPRGYLYNPTTKTFVTDIAGEPAKTQAQMLALATPGQELTLTCVPPGSGRRMGIDRDGDGVLDGDDNCPWTDNPDQKDSDGDGIGDGCDNCINVANGPLRSDAGPAQRDSSGGGYGNLCDGDLNHDGFVNYTDLGLFQGVFGSTNADADFDGNGFVNYYDLGMFRARFGTKPGPSGLAP